MSEIKKPEEVIIEDWMILAFVGDQKMAEKLQLKKVAISGWSVLFGILYFVYRKMYLITLFIFLAGVFFSRMTDIINYYTKMNLKFGFSAFLYPVAFYPLYNWDVRRKIKKIISKNPRVDAAGLKEMLEEAGGTALVPALMLGSVVVFYLALIIYFIFKAR